MVIIDKLTIPGVEKEYAERKYYIYLPDSYEYEPEKRYPVLYMFDGHNVFFDEDATYGKSWGMKEFLEYYEIEIIVAAVECNHSPKHGRLSEYSPYTFREKGFGEIKGRGKETMDWWVKTFKPMIDENFRTLPERENTYIAGSSMGGLMSVYALLEYNEYFSKAAALSPSLGFSKRKVLDLIKNSEVDPETYLYIDYGDLEFANCESTRADFGKAVAGLIAKGIKVTSRIIPGGTHCEASWEKQIPYFLGVLLDCDYYGEDYFSEEYYYEEGYGGYNEEYNEEMGD